MRPSIVVLSIVASSPALADPAPQTSLVDVLAVAVRQAPELERASLDLETARATWQRAIGLEDVRLTAVGSYAKNQLVAAGTTVDQATSTGSLDVGRNLPAGGSVHLTASSQKTTTNLVGVVPPPGYVSTVQLTWTQPLLRNFGFSVAREPRYEAAHRIDAAAADREARARDLVATIVIAYWDVALARARLDVRKTSLQLAEQQRTYTESAINIGKIPKSELLAVEQIIAVRKQDVLAAELEITQRSLDLRRIAGLDIGADALDVATVALPAIDRDDIDLRGAVAAALDHSAALASSAAIERAYAARVAAANNQLLPNLDLSVTAGPQGYGTDVGSSFGSITDGIVVNASLTAIYNIGRHDEHGQVRQTRADLLKAKVDTRLLRATVAADTARAVQLARAARTSVELGERAIELAKQNIEAEQHRFEDRKATNFDIILRQNDLEQAKLRYLAAIVDYLGARARLDALTGAILPKYGIKLAE
jgi:outer membrane protein TolC